MHKDEVKGAGNKARGAVKEVVGRTTNNKKLQAEGKMDRARGDIEQKAGKAKDAIRKH